VIQRQQIFVCWPTTNIWQNIIAKYSANNDKTDKCNFKPKMMSQHQNEKIAVFEVFLSREKKVLSARTGITKKGMRAQYQNQNLLNMTFVVFGRFAFVVVGRHVGRQRCPWITSRRYSE
jgi:hypothetical protein